MSFHVPSHYHSFNAIQYSDIDKTKRQTSDYSNSYTHHCKKFSSLKITLHYCQLFHQYKPCFSFQCKKLNSDFYRMIPTKNTQVEVHKKKLLSSAVYESQHRQAMRSISSLYAGYQRIYICRIFLQCSLRQRPIQFTKHCILSRPYHADT